MKRLLLLAVASMVLAAGMLAYVSFEPAPTILGAPPAGPVRQVVVEGRLDPLGFHRYTDLSSSTDLTDGGTFTIPARAHMVVLQVDTQNIRWRDFPSTLGDTTDPTATVGMQVLAAGTIRYSGNLWDFEMIEEASGAVVNASYYGY